MAERLRLPEQVGARAMSTDLTVFPQGEQLANALPGEVAVDEALICAVVTRINEIHRRRGLETAREIGEHLLAAFFGGHIEAFRAKGKKHASLRALADRQDLDISSTTIWYSIAVLEQLRQLPGDIGAALPMSHHRLLLPVKNNQLREELAREAVQHGLTKRDLEAKIKGLNESTEQSNGVRPGRPVLPGWAKGLAAARRSIEEAAGYNVTEADVVLHGAELVQARLDEVTATMAALDGLRAKLSAVLQQA
jgi:hypothetical protein